MSDTYHAVVEVLIQSSNQAEACDLMSEILNPALDADDETVLLDWRYPDVHDRRTSPEKVDFSPRQYQYFANHNKRSLDDFEVQLEIYESRGWSWLESQRCKMWMTRLSDSYERVLGREPSEAVINALIQHVGSDQSGHSFFGLDLPGARDLYDYDASREDIDEAMRFFLGKSIENRYQSHDA